MDYRLFVSMASRGQARFIWIRAGAAGVLIGAFLVASTLWRQAGGTSLPDADQLAGWMAPHRSAWYALPFVAVTFTALGLTLVPVIAMIAMTGVVFGPWLGPVYAMAGALTSASTGFALGRWAGRARVERLTGQRLRRVSHLLERNGTLAVFFLRKIPAPFMLTNIVIGASPVRYRDFLVGTLLGMTAIVIALAGFGGQITEIVGDPGPRTAATLAAFICGPLALAWFINRQLRRRASRHGADPAL
jgi:phospholipase D1/2